MNTPPSSSPNRPLPQWAYVPGETEEDANHDTLLQAKTAKGELTKTDWVAFSALGQT
ncbi:MAG TPA: hypothetical protein VGD96_19630 [Bradyrhizobium sp.]